MNVKLRKRHRYMWMVLGIALPLLCLEAIENIPKDVIADIPRHSCALEIGVCGISDDEHDFPIQIEQVKSKKAFGIQVSAPIKSAFTLVYLSKNQEADNSAVLMGTIHGMGEYQFALPDHVNDFKYVVLTDKLNDKTLYHEEFKTQ